MLGRGERPRRDEIAVRGAVAGLATAGGAIVAHSAAGGDVVPLAAVAALLVALPLSARVMRPDRTDAGRLVATSLVVQGLWHVFLAASSAVAPGGAGGHGAHAMEGMGQMGSMPAGHHHAGHASLDMLLLHLTAGLLAAAVAIGADRALVALLRELVGRLLPPLPRPLRLPVVVGCPVAPPERAPRTEVRCADPARGPPSRTSSPLLLA